MIHKRYLIPGPKVSLKLNPSQLYKDALLKEKAQILQFCAKLMCTQVPNSKVQKQNGPVKVEDGTEGRENEQLTPEKVISNLFWEGNPNPQF